MKDSVKEFDQFMQHFPQQISRELERFVTNKVLKQSRYLFIKTIKGIQSAYCTHCNRQHYPKDKLKHKQDEAAKCIHCKSSCEVRSAGMGRKYMADCAVLIWYEKSKIDNQAITARVLTVSRDYHLDYMNVKTHYAQEQLYLFREGEAVQYQPNGIKRASVFSKFDQYSGGTRRFVDNTNIRKAVRGTPFQYSTWERYTTWGNTHYVSDMVEFFDLAARYPCVEYLTKAGFEEYVRAKLTRESTSALNWKGKTLLKVLRLSKTELRDIKAAGGLTLQELKCYQVLRNKGILLKPDEVRKIAPGYNNMYYKIAKTFADEHIVIKYILKQIRKGKYTTSTTVLSDWRDYRGECEQLGISLSEERYLFPNDLHESHLKLSKRIKIKHDAALNAKIVQRVNELSKRKYTEGRFFIRPAASLVELFEEGKRLNHCVGQYAKQYAEGKTDIYVIRRVDHPNVPFYTVEIRNQQIAQARGLKNKPATSVVQKFIDSFVAAKLTKTKSNRRAKATA